MKNPPDIADVGSIPGSGRSSGEESGHPPTLVFLPGEFRGQRRLSGYSPWGRQESDMTERLTLLLFFRDLNGSHLLSYSSEVQKCEIDFSGLNIKGSAGLVHSGDSGGKSISLTFPASRGKYHSNLCLCHHVSSLTLLPPYCKDLWNYTEPTWIIQENFSSRASTPPYLESLFCHVS